MIIFKLSEDILILLFILFVVIFVVETFFGILELMYDFIIWVLIQCGAIKNDENNQA
jgi:hypothetical protein